VLFYKPLRLEKLLITKHYNVATFFTGLFAVTIPGFFNAQAM
jgi:hypothetical protein